MKDDKDYEFLEEGSLRERAQDSILRRKKQLRSRLILCNAALALLIIMIVFVTKLISLDKSDKASDGKKVEQAAKIQGSEAAEQGEEAAIPTPEPTPEPTEEPMGSDRWLRKDLDSSKPMVALTFDDGPYTPVTKEILKVAKKYDAKVTFFVVGDRVSTYSEVFKQAYEQGCELASHTYEHKILTTLDAKGIKEQVKKADDEIEKIIGCRTTTLRPPGGGVNDTVRANVGMPMICWSVDTEDWKSRNASSVLERCENISDADIVLMHDLYSSTAEAAKTLIPRLTEKGFQLVTIDELFYYKGIELEKGKVYFSAK